MYESSISWHIKLNVILCKRYQHKHSDTLKNALKLFSAGPTGEAHDAPPDLLGSIISAFSTSAKVPLFVESKKSLNYTMQHCSHPFGPCVPTDTNVTGLMVKGPQVSICPRAPSRSVTPLVYILSTQCAIQLVNNVDLICHSRVM